MEPCFNPAIEAQAIGRVWRLGQKRNVVITRLIMKNSVESRIVEMLKKKYGKGVGQKKPAAESDTQPAAMIGSLHADKAKVVSEEFDLLFGVPKKEANTHQPDTNKSEEGDHDDPSDMVI
jgi:hypothetical protein